MYFYFYLYLKLLLNSNYIKYDFKRKIKECTIFNRK